MLKYWYYRDRLKYFVVPGTKKGESEMATARNSNLNPNIDFGQHTVIQGYYIAMLATEYKILANAGELISAEKTKQELRLAIKSYINDQDSCEHYYDNSTIFWFDGFFIGTGIPIYFLEHNVMSPYVSYGNTFDGTFHFNLLNVDLQPDDYWVDYPRYQFNHEPRGHPGMVLPNEIPAAFIPNSVIPDPTGIEAMSQDEAVGLMLGLSLVYKLVPDDNVILNETNLDLRQSSRIIVQKMVDYM